MSSAPTSPGAGDLVFVDCPELARNHESLLAMIQGVIGPEGTLFVPTYTWSFAKGEPFDPVHSPSLCGSWSEFVRQQPNALRSLDPMISVAGLGPHAKGLLEDLPTETFGPNCFWERFNELDGIFCLETTQIPNAFVHYAETKSECPHRYDKLFPGILRRNGEDSKAVSIYRARDRSNPTTRTVPCSLSEEDVHVLEVGGIRLHTISAKSALQFLTNKISKDSFAFTQGGNLTPSRTDRKIDLHSGSALEDIVEQLWEIPRDILSDGYDDALKALANVLPMTIHEYPTGTPCWTWIVPEKWTCHDARLETESGEIVFSCADHPLHVMSYSLPVDRVISREELLRHLHVHPKIKDAIPFQFSYYAPNWGLCCTKEQRNTLKDKRYRVVIDSEFSAGSLKVGEVVAPGKSEDTIVLCAHLCHIHMVNDDMAGLAVGMEVMRQLQQRTDLHYNWRFLIVPETIGSLAFLSHHESLIPKMKAGLFLEMLGLPNPPALQLSHSGVTEWDELFTAIMQEHDPDGWTGPLPTVIGNDERQFNAPGVRVPMLSLSRVLKPDHPDWPFREYHSSHDNLETNSFNHVHDAVKLVLKFVDAAERNVTPKNKFRGEVFLSRYGLPPTGANRGTYYALLRMLSHLDGSASAWKISKQLELEFNLVTEVLSELEKHGLVKLSH